LVHLKKSWFFQPRILVKKHPPYGFFAPMSNLTKVPFWTSQFGPNHFDKIFLVGFFGWVFLIMFFLLSHRDNNIIWETTINIRYLSFLLEINMKILIN